MIQDIYAHTYTDDIQIYKLYEDIYIQRRQKVYDRASQKKKIWQVRSATTFAVFISCYQLLLRSWRHARRHARAATFRPAPARIFANIIVVLHHSPCYARLLARRYARHER